VSFDLSTLEQSVQGRAADWDALAQANFASEEWSATVIVRQTGELNLK
jgi:hypothetical protein